MYEPHQPSRRILLKSAAATTAALTVGTAASPALAAAPAPAAAPGGFPDYRYVKTLLTPGQLKYNPTGEIIFPCIRGAQGRVSAPLGRYYLYYAPHDAPGGICLAYGDHIEGPFTEYPHNPIVSNRWQPHYSVTHVSSPHVMWNESPRRCGLIPRREHRRGWPAPKDGINFTYDKVVLTASMLPAGTKETSYARVFPYELPAKNAHYVMLFMLNNTTDHRDIHWGWSADGRTWTFDQKALVSHTDVAAVNVGGPHLLTRGGSAFVVYNKDKESGGDLMITELGENFTLRRHLGRFYDSANGAPDNGRSAAPSFGTEGGVPYMVYEAGERLKGSIAVARG
ncbi:putative secreted protein [Streptomyces himastatinicus ATCC 53653]|uniref:Putative secreted protein n=1 Tax=Streptomyces himastatinicus ATCC 53653 TaxID=457427 RepID=D9WJB2_9ACTN|nr:hypothetical protein [Streptomyces himastatinicus]EFL29209.1 putative secreted protein [Streptomyces himastatinicus ATCC 53653]